jgi:hypothetical protein
MPKTKHTAITDPFAALQIIHLSDLHFGDDHLFKPVQTPDGDTPSYHGPTLLESIVNDLREPESPYWCVLPEIWAVWRKMTNGRSRAVSSEI